MKPHIKKGSIEKDLATKKELLEMKLDILREMHTLASTSKWQVIGAIAAMLFVEIALRHFGV